MIKKIIAAVLLLLSLWLLVGLINLRGIETPVILPAGEGLSAFDLQGLTCEDYRIPTRLTPGSWFEFDIVGELCWTGQLADKTLQVLIAGAGYGPVYWDFPYQPDTYSYKRAALRAGYATFNYYRTGIGASDHPFGILVNVENQVYVLSQLIDFLQAEKSVNSVVTVGHSLGSVIAMVHAGDYSRQLEGVVLTGFLHNSNPGFNLAMRDGTELAMFASDFAGDIVDPVYMLSKPNTRKDIFYTLANTDPQVPVVDELNRQTLTVAEIISMLKYFKMPASNIEVPVLIVTGEDDFVVCGGELSCKDSQKVADYEQSLFPKSACVDTLILAGVGHNLNLHKNARQPISWCWIGWRGD
ncbi:alpha/beta fold hydrolase [Oceanicoccus sagamiensis]|uniref:Serine aminopeptidase S33 domain-containing protein n=1 Tax=Oceanicoccus sagamiensis TaxID=716816 RepID=A0A1X9N6R8_9GAMM|nr:alpha/beta fold hydrolase [Oceanicoccus sagamiensis]ARN73396.1 hypothetical protein BST96_04280 [Oceanicoccus sagamiensis]